MIAKQYYALAVVAAFVGMVLSWLMRIHIGWPNISIPGPPAFVRCRCTWRCRYYLPLMTMHGTLMTFFALTSAPFAALGTYLLLIQIGAREMAFPRCNLFFLPGHIAIFLRSAQRIFRQRRPPISGWAGQYLLFGQLRSQEIFISTDGSSSFLYVFIATDAVFLSSGVLALVWIAWTFPTAPRQVHTLKSISLYWYLMVLLWLYLLPIFWGQL